MTKQEVNIAKTAFGFVLVIGIVNLFADMAYEGGRSIAGPFMGSLGASATIIGFVAGFGELLGYALRSVSGLFRGQVPKVLALHLSGIFHQRVCSAGAGARRQLATRRCFDHRGANWSSDSKAGG
jgi:hypothetical protein